MKENMGFIVTFSLMMITIIYLSGCVGSEIQEIDTEQSAEFLTCFGFCYQVELGAAAEVISDDDVQGLEDTLEDIKMVEEATQEGLRSTADTIKNIDERVEKIRDLDKELYEDNPSLKDVVK